MIRSFRLRLALHSALLSGVVLVVFGVSAWVLIRDVRETRIDQDLREHAEREVRQVRSHEDWQRIEARLAASIGVRDVQALVLRVEDAAGQLRYSSRPDVASAGFAGLPWPVRERPWQEARPEPPLTAIATRAWDGKRWRIGLASSGQGRVAVAVDTALLHDEMQGIRNALLAALPLALLLIGLGAWRISGRAMQPLQQLTEATRRIAADRLDTRISRQGLDQEFATLIDHYNGMLARLERSFHQAHRFSADAAHELKTPLAILQGQLERAMGMVEPGSPVQIELGSILDEVRRLATISRKLLLLSQADAGHLALLREPFDLSAALQELIEDLPLIAPGLTVRSTLADGLRIAADASLFPQILHNLLSNAVKYNVPGGWIEVTAGHSGDAVVIGVANASAGISAEAQAHLFERFCRDDPARGRRVEGVGLGLSVAREIARAHGGELTFRAEPDNAVRFLLRVPRLV